MLEVVSPAIDGPNLALVIRFEHMGEERFARWVGDADWREAATVHRLRRASTRRATRPVLALPRPRRWRCG